MTAILVVLLGLCGLYGLVCLMGWLEDRNDRRRHERRMEAHETAQRATTEAMERALDYNMRIIREWKEAQEEVGGEGWKHG